MRVFISSTVADLGPYRSVAERAALDTGWHPILLPEQPTVPFGRSVEKCVQTLLTCDALISIVGNRCGWVPTVDQGGNGLASITELELGTWLSHHSRLEKPGPVVFMSNGPTDVPVSDEDPVCRALQTTLRHKLRSRGEWLQPFDYFPATTEQRVDHDRALAAFRLTVTNQLHNLKHWNLNQQHAKAEKTKAEAYRRELEEAQQSSNEGFILALVVGGLVGVALASK